MDTQVSWIAESLCFLIARELRIVGGVESLSSWAQPERVLEV